MCYDTMTVTEIASRELRNNTRALLDRVGAGEEITITVDGRAVALLTAIRDRRRWVARDEFARSIAGRQADAGLRGELRELAPDLTDDLPLP